MHCVTCKITHPAKFVINGKCPCCGKDLNKKKFQLGAELGSFDVVELCDEVHTVMVERDGYTMVVEDVTLDELGNNHYTVLVRKEVK